MSDPEFDKLSKIYEESEKIKVNLEGKKLYKIRKQASESSEEFWAEQAKYLKWFKEWDKVHRLESSICKMVYWWQVKCVCQLSR